MSRPDSDRVDKVLSLIHELLSDEQFQLLKDKINGTSGEGIPLSIFTALTPFEAVSKYLHENKRMKYSEIASIVHRSADIVGMTYRRARSKMSKQFVVGDEESIPYTVFKPNLSVFESIVEYLSQSYSVKEIATLFGRHYRTILTIKQRAKKKEVNHEN